MQPTFMTSGSSYHTSLAFFFSFVWRVLPTTMAAAEHQHRFLSVMLLLLVFSSGIANGRSVIKTLPGFSGELPFYLETGYVGVGQNEKVQLFYYFVKSQRNPVFDPLMLWLSGGPGCSTLSAFFYENGRLLITIFGIQVGTRTFPVIFLFKRQYQNVLLSQMITSIFQPSNNKDNAIFGQTLNIIFVDAPVGSGFSYSKTQEGYIMEDLKYAAQTYEFLKKWLVDHPEFLKNELYVGGDSYSGIPVPMVVQEIYYGSPSLNLQGYVLGNPLTDTDNDVNSRIPFAHRLTLISDELYESAKTSCNGDYVTVNASNEQCVADMEAISKLIDQIYVMQVLEPNCGISSRKPKEGELNHTHFLTQLGEKSAYFCHEYNYVFSEIWANNKDVREALRVREGTKGHWVRCNITNLAFTKDVTSTVAYHQNLTNTGLRALIYSGDHDMSIPHIGTQEWINSLNLTLDDPWRAWYTDGQVAGYTETFTNDDFDLTFATGAGHVAIEYKPKECYAMIDRWFAHYPL
ncbi:Serine carboxypeptidase-like 18 [Vitis vinifera]|uniref:Serine carboxypeptidase-like 18 n=1 Tax=Vitis vinifera TaxID=29760 RepID=A0A438H850_VITVI|nr:Serine carboxypeptidase-like 18 [Vitis vinifera]